MGLVSCVRGLVLCLVSFARSFIIFVRYIWSLLKRPSMSREDLQVSLALYVLYPALLWLFLNVFHGVCGIEAYKQKKEGVEACKSIYFWFCFLMRSYKLAIVHVYGVEKQGSDRDLGREAREGGNQRRVKCRTWFHLSQEMTLVGWVAFLLLVCLPVLAFWSMFLSILVTSCNLFFLIRRLWHMAQTRAVSGSRQGQGDNAREADAEFQEFLANFTDEDPGW